ncbi:type II toxin-antitoxin system HicA family toxin [Oceanibaculum sp.]|uniref:type II toxin-antitoxin system HicA family toxin n=1 Tax=Oceanibaculum sp. TaxID=1903597 RepID=UPI0025910C60|nr:type II toxin-antitoxin system HicA family toxin [Oceanibaculum sp.]MCH2394626.1 type II toxin-antitoxin system HicA family toxin [Oceanibaculum sp.]
MNFRDFLRILEANGFELARQRGSHRTYRGVMNGETKIVVVACTREGDEIKPGTLGSMIRQSGLPKSLFR